jgi:hypothetical protein
MRRIGVAGFGLAVLTATLGCDPYMDVEHWAAPPLPIGGARNLVVTEGFGRDGVGRFYADTLVREANVNWYRASATNDRLEVGRDGPRLVSGDPFADSTIYVRVDVLLDDAVVNRSERIIERSDGSREVQVAELLIARSAIAFTATNHDGVLVLNNEFETVIEVEGPIDGRIINRALNDAAKNVLRRALALIEPVRLRAEVRLDNRDDFEVVDSARGKGAAERRQAAERLRAATSTAALYNRAVLLDSLEEYSEAELLYREALRRDDAADYYTETLAGFELRLRDATRLGLIRR